MIKKYFAKGQPTNDPHKGGFPSKKPHMPSGKNRGNNNPGGKK